MSGRPPLVTFTRGVACKQCGADEWRENADGWRCQRCSRTKAKKRYANQFARTGATRVVGSNAQREKRDIATYPPIQRPDYADPVARLMAIGYGSRLVDNAESPFPPPGRAGHAEPWRQPGGSALTRRHAVTHRGYWGEVTR